MNKLITWIVLLIVAGLAVKFIAVDMLWGNLKNKAEQISTLIQSNRDQEKSYQDSLATIISFSTTEKKTLQDQLKQMKTDYGKTLDSLKEQLVTVRTGTGTVSIVDIVDVKEPFMGDSLITFGTYFIDVKYNQYSRKATVGMEFTIELEGVETQDKYGNRRAIENVFLKSKKDPTKTLAIPWDAYYTYSKPKHNLWHWWNPTIQSDILISNPLKFGTSVNIMSFGIDKYIETTMAYIMCIGIASDFNNEVLLTVFPVKINVGQFLPLASNLNIGLGGGWDFTNQKPSLQLSVGVVH